MARGRPDNIRDDPGFWLCVPLLLFPPVWIIGLAVLIWNAPEIYREWKLERDCRRRGHHLWGEYRDHPYRDIPHQYCRHCHEPSPKLYALPVTPSEPEV